MRETPSLGAFVGEARRDVEAALDRWLPGPPDCPAHLAETMRYSLFAGGKRFRPVLVLAAADAVADGAPEARRLALPAACALELIHTYSLMHDDLPAMDDDTLRRGRPTAHVVYGEALAILAGDALLTEAFALLTREPGGVGPDIQARRIRTIGRIATAAGVAGMVGGQVLDLALAGQPPRGEDRPAQLADVHRRKTGALISAAAEAGALMAGAPDNRLGAVSDYAADLGLCFQIVDDVLDVEGASADLGKTSGKDAAAGKLTYPAVHGLERSRQLARECVERAEAALERAGLGGHLPAIAAWVLNRQA